MEQLFVLALVCLCIVLALSVRAFRRMHVRGSVGAFIRQSAGGLFRLVPARTRAWGTVYDALTKRPIPFAAVHLFDDHRRVLETRIADSEGRYGFLTSPDSLMHSVARVSLMASASGYHFPSQQPAGGDVALYQTPYRGEVVTIQHQTLVHFDIPMDPLQSGTRSSSQAPPSIAAGIAIAMAADAAFLVGFVAVPLSFLLMPNPFTFGTLCLFVGVASLRMSGVTERPFGTITDRITQQPLAYALVRLSDEHGKRVAFAVSDELGRYVMAVPRGRFELTISTPATIQPPRRLQQAVAVRRGWVTMALMV